MSLRHNLEAQPAIVPVERILAMESEARVQFADSVDPHHLPVSSRTGEGQTQETGKMVLPMVEKP
jgi:hypothetical protein